ncbi:MAG: hypothetical protein JWM99_2951 [Verrucomicrobiales bacterium]|nr:hypothetical protein [Verrucomicrobiales bacterium]
MGPKFPNGWEQIEHICRRAKKKAKVEAQRLAFGTPKNGRFMRFRCFFRSSWLAWKKRRGAPLPARTPYCASVDRWFRVSLGSLRKIVFWAKGNRVFFVFWSFVFKTFLSGPNIMQKHSNERMRGTARLITSKPSVDGHLLFTCF